MAITTLTALHGDSWSSPRWAVTLDGTPTDLSQWHIRAQARQTSEATDTVFEWASGDPGLVLGSAQVQLSDGTVLTTGTVQLRLRPADWEGRPRRWSGILDVELSSDATDTPEERHTVVAARRFQVTPDTAR